MTTTTHFEDRLLEQLRQIVVENPDPGLAPAAHERRGVPASRSRAAASPPRPPPSRSSRRAAT